jgi:pimeloyl-ACP methyl ester carboxylesterase
MSRNTFGIIILAFILCSSCAFNGRFHRPWHIPIPIETIPSFDFEGDTTFIDYDSETHQMNLLDQERSLINKNFSIKTMEFKSSSGHQLDAWLLRPTLKKPIATVLHFHGSAGNLLTQHESINPLIEYGFQILTFDYSGYGSSEGKATRKNVLKDAYSLVDFALTQTDLNETKMILYGQSYGGYLAAVVGANRQEDIAGIVVEGAFTSHQEEALHEAPFWGALVKNEKHTDQEIKKNQKPILIIHSREDQIVPIQFGQKIFENAHHPKEFYEIDHGHIQGLQYYSEEISNKIKKMLDE